MKRGTKMKWAAKAMALLLAGSAVLGGMTAAAPMTVQAATDSVIGTRPTEGSITIHKKGSTADDTLTGAAFSIYKIIDLQPGTTAGTWAAYSIDETFADMTGMPSADALGNYSTTELEKLITNLCAYIDANHIAADQSLSEAAGGGDAADGDFVFAGLDLGYYLVVETAAPAGHVAGKPFLIAVPSTDNYNNKDAAGTSWDYTVEASPKNPTVTIEKTQVTGGTADADDGTVKVGDFIKYEVTSTIPNYTDEYFSGDNNVVFTITDVMCDGLAIQKDTEHPVTVEVKAAGAADYATVAEDSGAYTLEATNKNGTAADLTVAFAKDYIENHRGAAVKVTYYAKVTEQAVSGNSGNPNQAGLQYNSQPNVTADATPAEVIVYTFDINVLKFAKEGNSNKKLEGAKFGLYSDATCTTAIGDIKTTGEDGKISFERLDEGTYYLKETQSPAGYTLLAEPIMVEIVATKDTDNRPTGDITLKVNGTAIPADAAGEYTTHVDGGNAVVAVENYPGFTLPTTGGAGIALFILIGAAGIIAVSVAMTKKTKKVQ